MALRRAFPVVPVVRARGELLRGRARPLLGAVRAAMMAGMGLVRWPPGAGRVWGRMAVPITRVPIAAPLDVASGR